MMSEEDPIRQLGWMPTSELNEHRRAVATAIADLKAAQLNMNLIANQNSLDKTPYLLSGQDTGDQERANAARTALDALARARALLDTLP